MSKLNIVCALAVVMAFTSPAQAASVCGNREDFVKALADKFKEQGKALAIAGQSNLLEIYTSQAGT